MKKKITILLVVFALVLSLGVASAADTSKIPQYVLDTHTEQGTDAVFVIWFPFVPDLLSYSWSSYIILSNFYDSPVTVNVWATGYGEVPTLKSYTLAPFEKKIITLSAFGLFDTAADIYCSSANFFGAAALLLDSSTLKVQTAFPPIIWSY
jgi:hypothetical protein